MADRRESFIVSFIFKEDGDDLMVVGKVEDKKAKYPQIVNAVSRESVRDMYEMLVGIGGVENESSETV